MAVVSVSLPDNLLEQVDSLIDARGYSGRSDLVRAALRDFVTRERENEVTGDVNATLTLLYPHGYERKIGEIRHEHTGIITSMMHGHAGEHCVEVFMLEGDAADVRAFVDALKRARETQLVRVAYVGRE